MKEIRKGGNALIRIDKCNYDGHEYCDIRQYYEADDGQFKPTKKGVTFSPDMIGEVIQGLSELSEELT